MSEPRLPWHAGRTTGRALYDGDGPDDLIGVMDTRELAAVVVAAVNAANAAVRGAQAQESASDEVAALTARLAVVERERDRLRRELAEMDDVAGNVAAERDDAEAALCAQDGRWRALVGRMMQYTWHWPVCERDVTSVCTCGLVEVRAQAQAALADAPPAPRGAAE